MQIKAAVATKSNADLEIQTVELDEPKENEGLALSREEMDYLMKVEKDLGRKLTDSEVSVSHRLTPNTVVTKSLGEHSSSTDRKWSLHCSK